MKKAILCIIKNNKYLSQSKEQILVTQIILFVKNNNTKRLLKLNYSVLSYFFMTVVVQKIANPYNLRLDNGFSIVILSKTSAVYTL